MTAPATSTHMISPVSGLPAISERTPATRCVIGLAATNTCSHPGIVVGLTNTLLRKVSGNSTSMLTPITDFSERRNSPNIVQTQENANENTTSSPTPATTPGTPPAGRKPSTSPITMIVVAARTYRSRSPKIAPTSAAGRQIGSVRNRSNTPFSMSVLTPTPVYMVIITTLVTMMP